MTVRRRPACVLACVTAAAEVQTTEERRGIINRLDNETPIIILELQTQYVTVLCPSVQLLHLRAINTKHPNTVVAVVGLIAFFITQSISVTSANCFIKTFHYRQQK